MQDLLFDTPWWLLILLIGSGGYVWYIGNTRSDKAWKIAGAVVGLLGVALVLVSYFVQTDKEYVQQQTRRIVAAADHKDWAELEKLLDPHTSLEGVYKNRDEIIDGAKKTSDYIGLSGITITSMEIKQTDSVIAVDMAVASTQDITMGRSTVTNWQFDWQNTGSGWKLGEIEPMSGSQVSKEELLKSMQR